mmetsp:Transcript_22855/g.49776  ORF Transcript_22855/g.49776 Transcript_22855/m.49776 type:complete len:98 (+) Transcript_22855:232-525(+)
MSWGGRFAFLSQTMGEDFLYFCPNAGAPWSWRYGGWWSRGAKVAGPARLDVWGDAMEAFQVEPSCFVDDFRGMVYENGATSSETLDVGVWGRDACDG